MKILKRILTRDRVSRLDALPNIGKKMASALRLIGIARPKQLIGMEPFKMYKDFMEGGDPLRWWLFTPERKRDKQSFSKRCF